MIRARATAGAALLLAVAGGLAAAAPAVAADPDPRALLPAPGTYELPPISHVGSFTLLDETGSPAPLLDVGPDEVAVVALIYTSCPSACPAALAILQEADREIARDPELAGRVRLVTVSFDPAVDTPEKMAALRDRMDPRSGWRFLTAGSDDAIAPVLAAFDQDALLRATRDGRLFRHVLKVFLVDGSGDVRNIYSTGFLTSELLLTDVRTVLLETPRDSRLAAD